MTKLGFFIALAVMFAYVAMVNSTRTLERLTGEHLGREKRQEDAEEPSLFYMVASGCQNILIFIVDFSFALDGGTMEIFAYKQGALPAVPNVITKTQMPNVNSVVAFYALFSEFGPCDVVVFNLTITDVHGKQTSGIISQQMGCPCLPIVVVEDPHVKCCGGNKVELQGHCKYSLLKEKNGTLEVNVQNAEATDHHGRRYLLYVEIMPANIRMYQNHTIQLSDGSWMKEDLYLPSKSDSKYSLFQSGSVLCFMRLDDNVRIDMRGHNLEIFIKNGEVGHTCGLCGNCNNNPLDDNQLCDGTVVESFTEFMGNNTISCGPE